MLDKLISNKDFDFAVLQMKNRPPMAVAKSACTVSREGDTIVLNVENGPHPTEENKAAAALHYVPISEITAVSYYTEKRIAAPGKLKTMAQA